MMIPPRCAATAMTAQKAWLTCRQLCAWPASPLALRSCPYALPGPPALCQPPADHGAFELREDAHHLKHRLAGWRRGVEALLMEHEVDSERAQLGQEADEILQRPAQPID